MKNIDFTGDSGRGTQNGEKEEDTILKRRRRILRDNCEPLLKRLCGVLFAATIGITAFNTLIEAISRTELQNTGSPAALYVRIVRSDFVVWCFAGLATAVLSAVQLYRLRRCGYVEKEYLFREEVQTSRHTAEFEPDEQFNPAGEDTDKRLQIFSRDISAEAERRYGRYMKITLAGAVVLIVLTLLTYL